MIDFVVRPDRFELPTFWFVARRSIQLSYGRLVAELTTLLMYPLEVVWRNIAEGESGTAAGGIGPAVRFWRRGVAVARKDQWAQENPLADQAADLVEHRVRGARLITAFVGMSEQQSKVLLDVVVNVHRGCPSGDLS